MFLLTPHTTFPLKILGRFPFALTSICAIWSRFTCDALAHTPRNCQGDVSDYILSVFIRLRVRVFVIVLLSEGRINHIELYPPGSNLNRQR